MRNANNEKRLHEVMGRLDKTFKSKLNEGFEELEASAEEVPVEEPAMDVDAIEEPVEQSPEEKLAELTAKVDELHAMLHGGEADDSPAEEVPVEPEAGDEVGVDVEVGAETLEECDSIAVEEPIDGTGIEKPVNEEESIAVEEPIDGTGIEKPVNEEDVPVAAVAKVGEAK